MKEEEEKSLKEYALKNGFTFVDPSAKKKELDDIYAEAANFKITKVSFLRKLIINIFIGISWWIRKNWQRTFFQINV